MVTYKLTILWQGEEMQTVQGGNSWTGIQDILTALYQTAMQEKIIQVTIKNEAINE